ncbi:hypothetical protein QR680_012357 [Steinernema hermaphroditum]|uniref:Aldehyde dehydrogenase domain-containing protein n=1 Tax=Steinernema hermaphroditum TaxID=289476 RepID=A0AA39M0M7_9BILA|nr:hypothetical protein QR680_012357 [Steinernema hermaphroditum]
MLLSPSSRRLSTLCGVRAGDIVYFHRYPKEQKNDFEGAVLSVTRVIDSNIYHVALVCNGAESGVVDCAATTVVHAVPSSGVVSESLADAVRSLGPDAIEICSVARTVGESAVLKASRWALEQRGAAYNDVFSPDCRDSRDRRAFYCCQLVDQAFRSTLEEKIFPKHELNFLDSSGTLNSYWKTYFEVRDRIVPQGLPGSHPSILRSSQINRIKSYIPVEKMRTFSVPRNLLETLHFVGGSRINVAGGSRFTVYEPRNGETLTECTSATADHIDEVAKVAREAQKDWGETPTKERGAILRRASDLIREHVEVISRWEVRDNGKPINEARADVLSCADTFDYFSGVDLSGLHFPLSDRDQRLAYTRREPLGVVGAIGAWNYPIQTATWKIAPAIASGNAIIYKPSPLAPVSSVILAHLLQFAGVPDGIVNILQGEGDTGKALCESKLVDKVSFTGSVNTGKRILRSCAELNVKPVTLELGGKSACIIMEDADLDMAVSGAMMANFYSQGQVCSNASKVLVHASVIDEFTERLAHRTKAMRVGDPHLESTHVGASISADHVKKVRGFIDTAVKQGAKLVCGGEPVRPEGLQDGYYLSPCVLSNVTKGMDVYSEEIFGAVLLVIPFETDEEALEMANDTEFGLANGVFTNDLKKANTFVNKLHSGTVYINTFNDISPLVPFGGYKQSGFGRENGRAAVENYTQVKSVFVNTSGRLDDPFPA